MNALWTATREYEDNHSATICMSLMNDECEKDEKLCGYDRTAAADNNENINNNDKGHRPFVIFYYLVSILRQQH